MLGHLQAPRQPGEHCPFFTLEDLESPSPIVGPEILNSPCLSCPGIWRTVKPGATIFQGAISTYLKAFLLEYSVPKCDRHPYLAADASCNVSHLDPVEFPDVKVFAIERLYLDLDT